MIRKGYGNKTYCAKLLICEVYDLPEPPVPLIPVRDPYPEEIYGTIQWFLARTYTTQDGCMIWTGSIYVYGRLSIDYRTCYPHRIIPFLLKFGTLDHALTVSDIFSHSIHICHTCDNPPCINPDHLIVANGAYNHLDAVIKGRKIEYTPFR